MRDISERLFEACDFCQIQVISFAVDGNYCIANTKRGNDFIKLTFGTDSRVDRLIDYIMQQISKL